MKAQFKATGQTEVVEKKHYLDPHKKKTKKTNSLWLRVPLPPTSSTDLKKQTAPAHFIRHTTWSLMKCDLQARSLAEDII